ncbi:MAG: DUF4097 family beta strand repeat protein [Anaerolineales bacterium]|nr:DUF4097 family beta strand repeat protein [Anaerolineales bacterium]
MKRPVVITLLVVALVLVCVGIGSVIYFATGFQTNNPFDGRNISSVVEESKTLKVDTESPVILNVTDDLGKITIVGADVATVQIDVTKTAYDSTQEKADQEVKAIKYSIEQNDNTIVIKYEVPNLNDFSEYNTVDFVITVPNQTSTNIEANFGEVNVSNTKGTVDIVNDFGDVTIENIEGALSVKTNSGEVTAIAIKADKADINLQSSFGGIALEKASGANITIDSNSGTVALNDVRATGEVVTKTDFGDTKFENGSANSLNIESNNGKVSLVKLKISKELKVDDDFGEIELEQASAGSYDLHTNSGGITLDGAKNEIKAYTDFGNIAIKNAESVTLDLKTNSGTIEFSGSLGEGPHLVNSDFGEISFALPADSKLNVDLKTDFGKISSDLPITVTLTESSNSDKDQIAGSINGGGGTLTAATNSGNIKITAIK